MFTLFAVIDYTLHTWETSEQYNVMLLECTVTCIMYCKYTQDLTEQYNSKCSECGKSASTSASAQIWSVKCASDGSSFQLAPSHPYCQLSIAYLRRKHCLTTDYWHHVYLFLKNWQFNYRHKNQTHPFNRRCCAIFLSELCLFTSLNSQNTLHMQSGRVFPSHWRDMQTLDIVCYFRHSILPKIEKNKQHK